MSHVAFQPDAGMSDISRLCSMDGDTLYRLAEDTKSGNIPHAGASRERFRREIMAVDGLEYTDTSDRLIEIASNIDFNDRALKAPAHLGIYTALLVGWGSIPLTFHYASAAKFNDLFVTADPPDIGDADTWLEVGTWAWNWMEPWGGTMSFFLLCMQFARDQYLSIGGKTAVEQLVSFQGKRRTRARMHPTTQAHRHTSALAYWHAHARVCARARVSCHAHVPCAVTKLFPQYDQNIVESYAAVLATSQEEKGTLQKEKEQIGQIAAYWKQQADQADS